MMETETVSTTLDCNFILTRLIAPETLMLYLLFGSTAWSFRNLIIRYLHRMSRGSSVSIVSDYRLDNSDSIPGIGKIFFSSLCVQTGSEAHPASCTVGTGGPFPRGKSRPERDADHSPPSSAEVKNE
jgi:hypothetical protein